MNYIDERRNSTSNLFCIQPKFIGKRFNGLCRSPCLHLCFLLAVSPLLAQAHQPVLLISVDGLRPDYVTQADEHHLRIPNLRRILADGTYADGVTGVFPTVTYPSHTTLVTGVWPAEHGILNNTRFDPERNLFNAWYWYADQIKTSTLWSAAHAAGLHTASVSWPVTVDATLIDTLIPEYWRTPSPGEAFNPDDRFLMNAISRPNGELMRIAQRTATPYMMGNDTTLDGDEVRTRYSLDILQQHRPEFMTIHLELARRRRTSARPLQSRGQRRPRRHRRNAGAALRAGAAQLPQRRRRYRFRPRLCQGETTPPTSTSPLSRRASFRSTNPPVALLSSNRGRRSRGSPDAWLPSSCTTQPTPQLVTQRVHCSTSWPPIRPTASRRDLDHAAVAALGGFPDAPFVVTFRPGYCNGGAISGPLVTDSSQKGTHGYNPATTPEMCASFIVTGQGSHRAEILALLTCQIAPTIAQLLGVSLPSAKQPALSLH